MPDISPVYSRMAASLPEDILGPILKEGSNPEVISFGGGLPCPEGFPSEALKEAADWCLDTLARRALQYSGPRGEPELLEQIAAYETARGNPTDTDEILVTSGSQQALDLCARALCNPGGKILIQRPTYVGALEAFSLSSPVYTELPEDAEGTNPDAIGEEARGCSFAYVIGSFSNPTGNTMSEARRKSLVRKAREFDFWIVEDDPYGELWYYEKPPVSIRNLAPERTIRLCSFSKILAPGMRLGYITAPKHVIRVLTDIQSYGVLSTPAVNQLIAARVMASGLLSEHLPEIRSIYRSHAETMQAALTEFMPKHPQISWTHPAGGMFVWLRLPNGTDTLKMLPEAVRRRLLYLPGCVFYGTNPETENIRLSFVTVSEERTFEGAATLARLVTEQLEG